MERYTIKLSFQPERRLGIILANFFTDTCHVGDSDDRAEPSIRGGGSTLDVDDEEPRNITRSLHSVHDNSVPLEVINDEALMFVLTGVVEKIEHTRRQPLKMAKVVLVKGQSKRRCRPYCRSDHFTTIYCANKPASSIACILREPQMYPLYITFMRPPPSNIHDSTERSSRSRCKRLRKSDPNIDVDQNKQPKYEVISLLDSSDEEDQEIKTLTNRGIAKLDGDASLQLSSKDSTTNSPPKPLLPKVVPPDPYRIPFDDDAFVLTPFGPGKIISSRVERYACDDDHSYATFFKPTVIYTIDLHYGTCHIPASQVTSISGTSYTEKTVITYQRAPLTEHDLLRLRPMTYLNDSIVNFYLKYLKTQYEQNSNIRPLTTERGWDDLDGEGIHIFPSFCYNRIKNTIGSGNHNSKMSRTKIWSDLSGWTKDVDIFKKKFLVFPINESLHWSCVFVCHPGRLVRRYSMDLQGRVESGVDLEDRTMCAIVLQSTTNPSASTYGNDKESVSDRASTDDIMITSFAGKGTSEDLKWRCDYCNKVEFDTYDEACEHEKICQDNVDRCMIHFDSGKHFKLHKTVKIMGVIRQYLNAYYEAEYSSSHHGLPSFAMKNMPGFAAKGVSQQDNTKDCGLYMLENIERMLQETNKIDSIFVKAKGPKKFFENNDYDKRIIEKKRDNILRLIQFFRRGDNAIK